MRRRLRALLPEVRHDHDPRIDRFDDGCWELRRGGELVGHVATTIGWYSTPFSPFTRHDWVWMLVRWNDGSREPPIEDYAPWSYVDELLGGTFQCDGPMLEAVPLPPELARRRWAELGITADQI